MDKYVCVYLCFVGAGKTESVAGRRKAEVWGSGSRAESRTRAN